MTPSIEIQMPADAARLVLLFHGVGATPDTMVPLGRVIAAHQPSAAVICVASPCPSDLGQGFQWFSVRGVTEENRPDRVAEAMPRFVDCVRAWQAKTGVRPKQTTLVGFSQGTIMALESTQRPVEIAHTIIGLSGRFARVPQSVAKTIAIALIHGEADPVIPIEQARGAFEALRSTGAAINLDTIPNLRHTIDSRVVEQTLKRL